MSGLRFAKKAISLSVIFLCIILNLSLTGCIEKPRFDPDDYFSETAVKSNREEFLFTAINKTIKSNLAIPISDSTEKKYQSAFWAMELIQYRNEFTDSVITACFSNLSLRSTGFQRAFLEVIYTLYKVEFGKEVELFISHTTDPKLFAMGVNYLKGLNVDLKPFVTDFLKRNKNLSDHPIIFMLDNQLQDESPEVLPIIDLLKEKFRNKTIIYSFQRKNRDYPGLAVIKKPDGKFLRNKDGEIFYISQLARAITDLPGYITNGNTPEGILSIQGIDFSKNTFIGPSPNLQLVLPYEVSPDKYFHNSITDSIWDNSLYANLLPDSWKNYMPIYEAYYAGKAGRNEIIAHGTTIDPGFYAGSSYYPYTPSLGCLTTKEIWSYETGKIAESDQIIFMNALSSVGSDKGFFIVVNIDNQNKPVSSVEIKEIILDAER